MKMALFIAALVVSTPSVACNPALNGIVLPPNRQTQVVDSGPNFVTSITICSSHYLVLTLEHPGLPISYPNNLGRDCCRTRVRPPSVWRTRLQSHLLRDWHSACCSVWFYQKHLSRAILDRPRDGRSRGERCSSYGLSTGARLTTTRHNPLHCRLGLNGKSGVWRTCQAAKLVDPLGVRQGYCRPIGAAS